MIAVVKKALQILADEGIRPESVTLTVEQYRLLVEEINGRREYASAPRHRGTTSVAFGTTQGLVHIRCGGTDR